MRPEPYAEIVGIGSNCFNKKFMQGYKGYVFSPFSQCHQAMKIPATIESCAAYILKHRWMALAMSMLLLVFTGWGGQFLKFTNDYRVFFSEENPELAAFENLQDTYTKNDNVLFMLLPDSGNVFTREALEAVVYLTEQSWTIPYSIRVDSIANFQHTYSEGDDLIVRDLIAHPGQLSLAEIAAIRHIATSEPLLVNNLVSGDGHATGINITVELPGINPTTEGPEVSEYVRQIRTAFAQQYPDIQIYATGIVEMNNAFATASQNDMIQLVPLAFLVIILGIFVFTRSISATIATAFVVIFSVIMAMGTAGWMGIELTGPSVSAPTMILTLAVADSVHFLITMILLVRTGTDKNSAIRESLRINFMPIFLTSVTTIIGFLSLNFSDSPPFRDLGNITAMGVGYAFILSVVFLPALMSVLLLKRGQQTGQKQVDKPMRLVGAIADFVINHHRKLFLALGAFSVFFVGMVAKNELNDVFVEYFDQSVEFRRHTDIVTAHLTGIYIIDFSLDSQNDGGISDPDYLTRVDKFAGWLAQQDEVLHVNVLTDVFKRLNKNLHGDDENWYRIPQERDLAAQYLLLYEMSLPYGLDLNNQINVDKSATRMSVKLKTLSTTQVLGFEDRIAAWFDANAPTLKVRGSSPTVIFSHIGMRNIISMLSGTTLALVLISLVLVFALRSLKIGAISLLPNLLPIGVAFGIWGLSVGQVGLALSVVAGMTLGIVVDDTVHFLSKYLRARRERSLNAEQAIRYAFSTVGVALIVNTLILVAGFLVLSTSSFKINNEMGLVTALTLALALILDFLLLPAVLLKFDGENPGKTIEEKRVLSDV